MNDVRDWNFCYTTDTTNWRLTRDNTRLREHNRRLKIYNHALTGLLLGFVSVYILDQLPRLLAFLQSLLP
mgnify:CR=1 FL=1